MKNIIIAAIVIAIFFVSCSNKQSQAAKSMADEMCKAMELIKADDPMSSIEAASAMTAIAEKTELYSNVSEKELIEAMKKACPEGAEKYIAISPSAEEAASK